MLKIVGVFAVIFMLAPAGGSFSLNVLVSDVIEFTVNVLSGCATSTSKIGELALAEGTSESVTCA